MAITEADVYNTLSLSIWKSPKEIRDEIVKRKHIGEIGETFSGLDLFYTHLGNIVDRGYAESRQRRISEERLQSRRGRPELEYHLTEDGLRARDKYLEKIVGQAIPEKA